MSLLEKYTLSTNINTFHNFLDDTLINIKNDFQHYNLNNGFISFLDEEKISEKFTLISAMGSFINKDNINIISAKEIDILSIVYISKKSLFKENTFIDIIQKDKLDIFLYLEFENKLTDEDKDELNIFFKQLNKLIIEKNWEL